MTRHTPSSNRRNRKTFIASLLAYVLLTSQLAPIAMAFNRSADRRAPAGTSDVERRKASEAPPQGRVAGSFAPVPVPLRVTAAGMVPNISAMKTDSFTDVGGGRAAPGSIITYNITITNSGPDPATNVTLTDTVDPNTTIVPGSAVSTPIAFDDAYNVIGNVRIQPNAAQGLLANDINPNTGDNMGLTASGPITSTAGGQVAINSDGSFSYNPPPGFTGTDDFNYTVTSANGVDTGKVTLTVGNGAGVGANVIWFVNSAAAVGGDGRLTNPFNCYTGTSGGAQTCFSDTAADDPGDSIFLFNGGYSGGYALLANQKLIGQGASATLASIAGATVPTGSDALPATNGNPANVTLTTTVAATNAIPVSAGGITLRGFTVGNTTGTKIFGSGFGTLTAGNSTTPDLVLNGTGKALDLTTGTFAATSAFSSVTTTSSGTQGISLAGVLGTVAFGSTTVSGNTTQCILVGTTQANINFGNTSCTGGTDGVSFQNNSAGTRTFGTLGVSGGSGNAFLHGAGGGNVTVTGAATLSSTLDAISVSAPTNTNVINFQAATSATRTSSGGNGVNWAGTAGATMMFSALTIQTNAGTGLNATVGGTINVTTGTGTINNTVQPASAIVANGIALNANFSAINSSGGTSGVSLTNVTGTSNFGSGSLSGASGATFLVSGGTASTTFAGGVTQANNAAMVSVLGGHSGTLTFNTGTLSATNGTGLQFDNADGTYNFNGTNTLNGGDAGIDIQNNSGGTFVFSSNTSINNPSGVAYREDTSTATVTYDGTITKTNNANNAVDINAKTSGATTFSGAISATTTTVNAIDLTNTGGTVTFRGGLVVSTTSGVGFNATGAGTTVNVCDENPCLPGSTGALVNTLTSTTGTALNVANTTIGANNLEFRSISANGGSNGIVLNTTGASGGLKVSGNGGTCTDADKTGCSGGTIQNLVGGDDSGLTPVGTGIVLNSTQNVSLTRMYIHDATNYGVNGTSVTGFTLNNSVISGSNGTNVNSPFRDSSMTFDNLLGTVSFANDFISGGVLRNIEITNTSGSLNITVNACTIHDTGKSPFTGGLEGDDNLNISNQSTANITAHITNNTFSQASGDHFNGSLSGSGTVTYVITGNNYSNTLTGGRTTLLGGGFFILGGSYNGTFTYNISNNGSVGTPLTGNNSGGAIVVNKGTGSASFSGRIVNNVIGNPGVVGSGSQNASGIAIDAHGTGSHTTLVTNNLVRQFHNSGIELTGGESAGVTFDATVTANTVSNPDNLSGASGHGVHVNMGTLPADSLTACMDIQNKLPTGTIAGGGEDGDNGTLNDGQFDLRMRQRQSAAVVVRIPGFAGGANADAFETGVNTLTTVATSAVSTFGGGGACATAANPTAPATIFKTTTLDSATGEIPSGASRQQLITAPSNTDSVANRPFISSPRIQPAATATGSTAQAASVFPSLAARAAEIIPANRNTSAELNPFGLGIGSKRDGGAAFNYAAAGTSAPLGQTQTRGSQDKQTQGGGGKTSAPSTTASTPQQTGAPTKPTVQTPVPGVVVDPGVRYIPKPRPVTPPVGDGTPPVIMGDTLTWNVGTLPANSSVTITFQVVIDNPFMGAMSQVSNQGSISFGGGGGPVLTDDPSVGGMADPTVTLIALPPDVFIRDAKVAEPTSGTTSMLFSVALSTPATQMTTINYSTADGSAVAPGDYVAVASSSITFMPGEQLKTIPITVNSDPDNTEVDENFTVNITANPSVANVVDGSATGTITVANNAGTVLITELRTSGPTDPADEFVEIYNNTGTPHTVPAGGYGLFKIGADCNALPVLIGTIPATTVIPARGHYLFVGNTYSLANYGGTGAAAGNATLTSDIEMDRNVALFSTVDPLAISTANRLDAVGFGLNTGGVCDLLLEGTTLPPASGSTSEHSFVREFTLNTKIPTAADVNDNAADFTLVSTTPGTPVGSRLGAPGPENLTSPVLKPFTQVLPALLDSTQSESGSRNRVRDLTPVTNGTLGTLSIRRRFTNNTGGNITRLRFRIYDITTAPPPPPPPATADLRALTSVNVVVAGVADPATCAPAMTPCTVTVQGTTLETPPAQPNGGGLNSSLSAGTVSLGTPLGSGSSINLQFLFGVQQSGGFRVFVFVEALP